MILRIALGVLLLILGGLWIWMRSPRSVAESRFQVSGEEGQFPVVSGSNLQRQEFEFPRDFEGQINFLLIPFQREQQKDVNTWVPLAQKLERSFPGLVYYELPTIRKLPVLSRTFINEGMRAGIPDRTARERTVTLYIDKDKFKEVLEIKTESTIHLFLLDEDGNILWRDSGTYTDDKARDLTAAVEKAME